MRKILKKSLLLALAVIATVSFTAGQQGILNPSQYLFPDFSKGTVAMKAGRDLTLLLNYNIVTGRMVFLQKGDVYDMMNYTGVDTVYMSGSSFVPVGDVFYEVGIEGKFPLFIQHSGKIQSPPKPAAYGGTSEVSSSNYIDNIRLGTDVYRLKTDPDLIIKPETLYWTLEDGGWVMIKSLKHLSKIMEISYNDVNSYLKEKGYRFDVPTDIINVVRHFIYKQ